MSLVIQRLGNALLNETSSMPNNCLVLAMLVLLLTAFGLNASTTSPARQSAKKQPNIIWLILDDASPTLGCYGDAQAITPNMDRLAQEGARFTRAFTHAPVCAPSRSGLVTGMYPTTIGSHHMRSKLINPPETFMSLLAVRVSLFARGFRSSKEPEFFGIAPPGRLAILSSTAYN